ncbi:hypothetical protein D3C85_1005210 [compost metagenome]
MGCAPRPLGMGGSFICWESQLSSDSMPDSARLINCLAKTVFIRIGARNAIAVVHPSPCSMLEPVKSMN